MSKTICIYDNHYKPNLFIKSVIGSKLFGDVILKRKSIKSKFYDFIKNIETIDEVIQINYDYEIQEFLTDLKNKDSNTKIVHIFSFFVCKDVEKVRVLFDKVQYITENYAVIANNKISMFMMNNLYDYCDFISKNYHILNDPFIYQSNNFQFIENDCFHDLSIHENFLQYISGGFDARFFNSVKGDEFVVTKSSTNKNKIKAEYMFYGLLPDTMKMWFVMPYNYKEYDDHSSYDMERYHMTDLAIRYVHGAIDKDELDGLLIKCFHFITARASKNITEEDYKKIAYKLYIKKVEDRISDLKANPKYKIFDNFIKYGTKYDSIDTIVDEYKKIYDQIMGKTKLKYISVIGHGDPCFSNILFNKEAQLLKLIDPKGAVKEEELWTDPYYDIAKLSHSICGRYDFFNNGLYQILLNDDLKFTLEIDFENTEFIKIFKKHVENNEFNFEFVRICEASLFLSMLPLHMDNPQKVFGFILNAINIMEEIKNV